MSNYETLAAINVNDHVEKKQKFSYLSWAWAVDTLMRSDPTANWEYRDSKIFADGTMMVFCTVTAFGVPRTMQLPVINHSNKPISNPNAFDINTSMQRCLVKAIALHGLGLYLYAGEDLPPDTEPKSDWDTWMTDKAMPIVDYLAKGNVSAARDAYEAGMFELPDEILQTKFHKMFSSAERSALKTEGKRRADENARTEAAKENKEVEPDLHADAGNRDSN